MRGLSERRWILLAGAAIVACVACAPAPPVSPVVTVEAVAPPPGVDPLTPAERLLALLADDNPRIERVAMSLASLGDGETTRAAGRRLVTMARAVGSEAWRRAEQARLDAEGAARPIEDREAEAIARILAAMSHVGGPAVAGYCFAVAEDEAAPGDRRRLAIRVLDRVLDAGDAAGIARRARVAARVPAVVPRSAGSSPGDVLVPLRRAAKNCFVRALQQDPTFSARVTLTLRVGARGAVSAAVVGQLPADFERCLVSAGNGLQITDPAWAGTALSMPLMFMPQR